MQSDEHYVFCAALVVRRTADWGPTPPNLTWQSLSLMIMSKGAMCGALSAVSSMVTCSHTQIRSLKEK